jgi:membrane dipeptidase
MPANGGVVMVTFVPGFVSKEVFEYERAEGRVINDLRKATPRDTAAIRRGTEEWRAQHPRPQATVAQAADHIEYVRRVAGVDHVGIGGDFDGITNVIKGLEDVSTYPALFAELARRGWSDEDLRKLAGENILRVMARAEEVSATLKKERAPSNRTITELDGPQPSAK